MASREKVKYEGRKLSNSVWGLFISETEICYGTAKGKSAKINVERLAKRLNESVDHFDQNTDDKKAKEKK